MIKSVPITTDFASAVIGILAFSLFIPTVLLKLVVGKLVLELEEGGDGEVVDLRAESLDGAGNDGREE